jgi:hypothetical protein
MGGHGAYTQHAVCDGDAAQFGYPANVHQQRRGGQSQVQRRQQALAAGQQPRLAGVVGQQVRGLGDAAGTDVVERCGFQDAVPP